jgi:hypothetical protein
MNQSKMGSLWKRGIKKTFNLTTGKYVTITKKMALKSIVLQIISLNQDFSKFWGNAKDWAPLEAANLLSRSRLDWQASLSQSLQHWIGKKNLSDGDLILAWANLGSLVEGTMKLFLSIFYDDYKKDIHAIKNKNGKLIDPDELKLEYLKQFFKKQKILIGWPEFHK